MSFAARLVWGTILVIVVAIAVHVVGAEIALRGDLERDTRANLEREARLVARALSADSLAWLGDVAHIARETGLRVTLIAPDGRVVAESEEAPESVPRMENHAERPEIREALAGRVGSDRRVSATVNRPLLYVAVPGGPGVVRVAAPLAATDTILSHVHNAFFGAALVALLIGSGLALVAGRSIARPLTTISQAARSIAQGAVPRFPRSGVPDIDELVRALREMHQQLDERFADLRRERAESAALVEAMVEGVIAADARGRIVTANGAARRLLGYEPEATLPALPQLFRAKAAREVVDAVLDGQRIPERELELDGQSVLLSARPLAHGGALLVLHDVTELRRLETVRRDFVANVSHELKTPLTSISGYAETLVQDPPDAETMRRFLGVIHNNARRMQRLVDGLLDLSKIESGGWRPAPEPVEIGAVARESWGLLADRAEQRKISYLGSVGPEAASVFADPDAVRQVLSNLFDNAIRHTPAGGRITFSAARRDGGVQLEVRDTGAGIPADHLPRIFERFYRADPGRARDDGGTGLGLAIVKHLVEAHEGEVDAESQLGRGTAIRCWFPDEAGIRS
ncbi:MAG: PAS domain-containing protein [Gemmatimonadetes bacterium]|jgi:two-component system phosphate regulon sensor histidine kinase PhoR|nr:PAS domain-containing protein [Gemmatimonadota bacterium]MBP6667842.1 PAS domain-containing protein [Gemmatimonadales bacterium]MBK6780127.1 PAS domain-containing protein [Gemmatimonadota bacterium]MBK7350868.1 PAS domain-containing protein [Gemmatimonadota bacterium]MBK7786028.1 PAS domain-containing protein [Gemmatimonadota bacterium]